MSLRRGQVQILVEERPIFLPARARTVCNLSALALKAPKNLVYITRNLQVVFDLNVYFLLRMSFL